MAFGKTLTVRESAAYLRVSTKTIRRYIKRGLLKYRLTPGLHGTEIHIFKRSLDRFIGQNGGVSKAKDDLSELTHLYRKAPQEVREVVLKILRSSLEPDEPPRPNGLLASIFKRRSEDYQ